MGNIYKVLFFILLPILSYAQTCDLDLENFETSTNLNAPAGWQRLNSYFGNIAPYSGTVHTGFNTLGDQLIVEPLNCPGEICFYWRASGTTSNYDIDIDWSDDNGLTWNTAQTINLNGSSTPTTYSQICVDLPENLYNPPFSDILIRFHQSRRVSGSFYLDDVCISSGTCSLVPTELRVSSLTGNCIPINTPFSLQVCATDNNGYIDPSYTGNITLSKILGTGTLGGTLIQNAVNGCTEFNDLTLSQAGSYDIQATTGTLNGLLTNFEIREQCPSLDTLRVMSYNLLNFPNGRNDCGTNTVIPNRWDSLAIITEYIQPDILMACELQTEEGADSIIHQALNINGKTNYARANFVLNQSNSVKDLNNMIFYNTSKLVLYQQNEVITNVRDIGYYTFYVNDPNLPLTLDTTFLDVYVGHLKAGSTDALARAVGCDSLRKYIDTATSSRNVIFGGDFNFYDASEAGYQTLLSGVYPFYDPINSPGNWSNNTSFTAVHTQSTRATGTSLDCGAQGGIDDRFDFILATGNIITGSNSISYIPNSYKALGNDGNLFNDAINDPTNSSNIPFTVLNALHNTSDHLPIIMDLEVTYSQLNLSLEILNFRGYAQKDGSHLDWSIADANDVVYWVIERSEQGVDFSVIETLSNKSNQLTWEFLDQTTHAKVAYYRIKAIMKDGEQIYSSTIAIKTFSNDSQFRLFPNPANNYISFEYFLKGEKGLLTVFNSLGEHVKQVVYSSNQRVHTIDIQDLPTGIYNIEFISENHQYLRKFIKD